MQAVDHIRLEGTDEREEAAPALFTRANQKTKKNSQIIRYKNTHLHTPAGTRADERFLKNNHQYGYENEASVTCTYAYLLSDKPT